MEAMLLLSWTHCIHLLEELTQWQGLDLLLEGTATVVLPSPRCMGIVLGVSPAG